MIHSMGISFLGWMACETEFRRAVLQSAKTIDRLRLVKAATIGCLVWLVAAVWLRHAVLTVGGHGLLILILLAMIEVERKWSRQHAWCTYLNGHLHGWNEKPVNLQWRV